MSDGDGVAGDDASEERQLFGEQVATWTGFVACELGIARVSLAGGRVGQAGLVERCTATSVAADGERVVAGTTQGVLADEGDGFDPLGESFDVAAVGLTAGGRTLAAGADGRVLAFEGEDWERVGEVTDPQQFDGDLLAAGDGVYRVAETLEPLGLSAAHDVAGGEKTFVATAEGLYRADGSGGWEREHDRPTTVVVAAEGRAHAIDDGGVLERVDGVWKRRDAPERPVDIAYTDGTCAITADGTLLASDGPDAPGDEQRRWRSHPLGLRGVVEFVVQ